MHFLVIGHVDHKKSDNQYFAYGPYVREMNLWFKHVDQVTVVAPLNSQALPDPIDLPYQHSNLRLLDIPSFNIQSISGILNTLINLPRIWGVTWKAMKQADHIHLRCPGNMGLMASIIQIFFPSKEKSAKYAGNWDKNSKQPFTYRLQQAILTNTFLTKNMQVLVYGEWPNESKNVRPFFTASYSKNEIETINQKSISNTGPIRLIFVGGLNSGKQPLISAKVCLELLQKGNEVYLDYYGEGPERSKIESFIKENELSERIILHGNVPAPEVKKAFQNSHFLIFISQSEGWPKVVAESMFWACLPITTAVSCVPQMLGFGERGEIVNDDVEEITSKIQTLIDSPDLYLEKTSKAANWSRQFTLEKFESELQTVLNRP
ncbi:glycosyltransferase [Algoriphagus sp.]|uniref:glycosyltransferase family 4 protein n=1 Tax=Algoriphagus sp. TaxID=1872435 RepID=UPI0025DAEF5B|nr:glycosyltransferase [Algoriphagus sp.]